MSLETEVRYTLAAIAGGLALAHLLAWIFA
jgi:hypothetical protein